MLIPLNFRSCATPILTAVLLAALASPTQAAERPVEVKRGICAVLGLTETEGANLPVDIASGNELTVYFQSPSAEEVAAVRKAAEKAGLLGTRVFADQGSWDRVHLADNLAGAVLVAPEAEKKIAREEVLRVLHPRGKAIIGDDEIVKPAPDGVDSWSHPYHGPDNNPQSTDELARAPYVTQFLADPLFCPMPEVSVAAGGRVFRAFGHIAHKANQNAVLNTLICYNGYNGTILWKRPLTEGFMIHRNTMIATPEVLYMADDRSCKMIDAATGEVRDEIIVPKGLGAGPVWKWMALVDGVLYALVGDKEVNISTKPSQTPGMGHWPWGMWEGHEYADPKTSFGFGRTFLAIDPKTKNVRWAHNEEEYLDSRGVCMKNGRIYVYCPGKFLGCLDAGDGSVLWRNTDADLLKAIGPEGRAQHYVTGYSTQTYIKCNDDMLFFSGSQRNRLVVASATDGKLLWQKEQGNYQLVLRDDGIYAAGPQQSNTPGQYPGMKLDYQTGEVLSRMPLRRACTRATGSVDSVFYRASGGTIRVEAATNRATHIAPMRPPCQDGVIISDGNLYWGPWMCGCQLSLYGHICLTSAGDRDLTPGLDDSRLELAAGSDPIQPLDVRSGDWPTYQGDNARRSTTTAKIPNRVARAWTFDVPGQGFPTAPVTAGGMVFFGDRNGTVRAVDAASGKLRWQVHTSGAIYFPPTIADGRLFVGSADGRVYALEAATGRALWTFRAAPLRRWIPVYGKLISTWPVAGGVVAHDGVVYAAAGIAHYDTTHVYALDGATGKVKWYNDTSGTTSEKVDNGVSLQGSLSIRGGELRFAAGGVHEEARYDLATGKCLNTPSDFPRSTRHTAFYAYFPDYGKYASLDCTLADGKTFCYDATYDGSWHSGLSLLPPLPPGQHRPVKPISRWGVQRRPGQATATIWRKPPGARYNSFIVADNALVVAGHPGLDGTKTSFLVALNLKDGTAVWRQPLPGPVVKSGTAVDHTGRIFVALEDGRIVAFSAAD